MAEQQGNQFDHGTFGATAPPANAESLLNAPWMFWISLAYLATLALLLPHGGSDKPLSEQVLFHPVTPAILLAIWAVVIAEAIWSWRHAPDGERSWKRLLLVALLPPFRMVISPRRPNGKVWLPLYGWRNVAPSSVIEMEQHTAIPMLIATALIVPVLIVDFGFPTAVEDSFQVRVALAILMSLIWFSFALEFVVMVSLAPKKLDYCKRHWINIVIIVLPLIAFLRSLQLFRFLKVAQAGKLAKVYRLRGLMTRSLKIALAFNLIDRILSNNPEKYCASLEEKIAEKEEELAELRDKLGQMQRSMVDRSQAQGNEESRPD